MPIVLTNGAAVSAAAAHMGYHDATQARLSAMRFALNPTSIVGSSLVAVVFEKQNVFTVLSAYF